MQLGSRGDGLPISRNPACKQMFQREMLDFFKQWTTYLAGGIEAAAALLVTISAMEALFRALPLLLRRGDPLNEEKEALRLRLGHWLTVAIEFELAADILRTAVAPTWNIIGQLAAIVVLRTVLNYFLQQEIARTARRKADQAFEPPVTLASNLHLGD
jgi:uncharacterized membrane protein